MANLNNLDEFVDLNMLGQWTDQDIYATNKNSKHFMEKPSLKLMGGKILVKPLTLEDDRQGGIIKPNNFNLNRNLEQGTVILLSADNLNIQEGDRIIYPTNAGIPLSWNFTDYKFLNGPIDNNPGDVWAIV